MIKEALRTDYLRALEAIQAAKVVALNPPLDLNVSQFADTERRLSVESSAEPGQWDTSRAEYQREIMDAFYDPNVHTVVVQSSSQVGKTSILENIIAYYIAHDACPILVVMPTLTLGQAFSKDRLAPMLRDTPALHGKVKDARSRDGENTTLHKKFPGGHITIAGANSPASLASRPIRIVLCDEVDRFPFSAGPEGDPVDLAFKRSTTFWNKKHGLFSTPTIKGTSRIEKAFIESDQRHRYVTCPHCGKDQTLKWRQVHWEKSDQGEHLPETATYACEHCGVCWSDAERWRSVNQGYWEAHAPFNGIAGFFLNELYSPWVELKSTVTAFLKAKDDPERLKTWTNTTLGETWELKGKGVKDQALLDRVEAYGPESLPADILLLTAGVDVQDDRLEVLVTGWGYGEQAWHCEQIVLHGDPSTDALWTELDEVLRSAYLTEDGRRLSIAATCLDTGGHYTQEAYSFCKPRERWRRKVWAIKGKSEQGRPVWPLHYSKANKGKVPLFTLGVDAAKETLYARLNRVIEPGFGYIHFSRDCDAEYFKQLTAEKLVIEIFKGRKVRRWKKKGNTRNEVLDLWVYAYAALCGLQQRHRLDLTKEKPISIPTAVPIFKKESQNSKSVFQGSPSKAEHKKDLGYVLPEDPYLL